MILDIETIEIPCPQCGHKTKKTIGWIKRHSDYKCTCGEDIHLEAGQFRREMKKVDREYKGFQKSLKKLNRQINFR